MKELRECAGHRRLRAAGSSSFILDGKIESKSRSARRIWFEGDVATMIKNDAPANSEPEPGAVVFCSEQRRERVNAFGLIDAAAVVANFKEQSAFGAVNFQFDDAGAGFETVLDEINQHLLDLIGVAV